jgi:hypothetical protein
VLAAATLGRAAAIATARANERAREM